MKDKRQWSAQITEKLLYRPAFALECFRDNKISKKKKIVLFIVLFVLFVRELKKKCKKVILTYHDIFFSIFISFTFLLSFWFKAECAFHIVCVRVCVFYFAKSLLVCCLRLWLIVDGNTFEQTWARRLDETCLTGKPHNTHSFQMLEWPM